MSQHLTYKLATLPKKGWRDTAGLEGSISRGRRQGRRPCGPTPTGRPREGSHNKRWQGADDQVAAREVRRGVQQRAGCDDLSRRVLRRRREGRVGHVLQLRRPGREVAERRTSRAAARCTTARTTTATARSTTTASTAASTASQGWWGTLPRVDARLAADPGAAARGRRSTASSSRSATSRRSSRTRSTRRAPSCSAVAATRRTITHDVHGSANDDCADVNPGATARRDDELPRPQPAAADRGPHRELRGVEPAGRRLRDHASRTKVSRERREHVRRRTGSTWTYNTNAKDLYEVQMTVSYVVEGCPGTDADRLQEQRLDRRLPLHPRARHDRQDHRRPVLHRLRERPRRLPVVADRHVEPVEPERRRRERQEADPRPWHRERWRRRWRQREGVPRRCRTCDSRQRHRGCHGRRARSAACSGSKSRSSVSVDITHTYRGDLVVDLLHDGTVVKNLANGTGGDADNIQRDVHRDRERSRLRARMAAGRSERSTPPRRTPARSTASSSASSNCFPHT